MTHRSNQKPQQEDRGWLSPVLLSILAAVSPIATIDMTSLATAAECQGTDVMGDNTIGEMGTWKGTTLAIPPLTLTVERDIFGALEPFPAVGGAPSIKGSRTVWGNAESQLKATSEVCGGEPVRRDASLFNQAILRSIVKTPPKANTQVMKVPPLLYNGKRQTLRIRTTLPEIEISQRYQATSLGPVLEIPKPGGPNDRGMSQTVAMPASPIQSPSALRTPPLLAFSPFENAPQLPVNESLRMNLTTTHALQGGNCASGCP